MDVIDQGQFVALAREFGEGEIRPHTEAWERAGGVPEEVLRMLGQTGFLGMTVPERYEGLGLDVDVYLEILSTLAWADPAVALAVAVHEVAGHHVLRRGGDVMRDAWLPRFASGEILLSYALHEPGAGAHMDALETVFTAADGGVTVSGDKDWVTNADVADRIVVFGRREGEPASALVDPRAEGCSLAPVRTTMGLKAARTGRVRMEGVGVREGEWIAAGGSAEHGGAARLVLQASMAAICNGLSEAALDHATRYATEREQFDRPLASFGAIRDKLGAMGARLNASRALTRQAGARLGDPEAGTGGYDSVAALCASAKAVGSDTAVFVTDESVQIFGGYGYMRDYPVEKLMRDARGLAVLGGTGDAMRATVAEQVLRETEG